MIPVTKPYLPKRENLERYIDEIYERNWLTNNGPLLEQLTQKLQDYLGVKNLLLVSNGTLALQIAYQALGLSGNNSVSKIEAVTTPFTFMATGSSLQWEGVKPVFVDINSKSWCLDSENIEAVITKNTRAIVPVHVFGNACEVEKIDEIAKKHSIKVVYDASHAFGVDYKGQSLLNWGDASTLSFHATKLFHTIEGGAIVFKRETDLEIAKKMINFGLPGTHGETVLGINAKMNEFQAAMGLCIIDELETINRERAKIVSYYEKHLEVELVKQVWNSGTNNNSYYPVLFKSEKLLLSTVEELERNSIYPRRYFYPTLDKMDVFVESKNLDIAVDISNRVLCLPLYVGLNELKVSKICKIINKAGYLCE